MKKATNIEEVKENVREFAEIVNKAYKDFLDSDCHNEEGYRIIVGIFNNEEVDDWIEKNNKIKGRERINRKTCFISIREGIEYVGAFDFFANMVPLQ